MGTKADPTTERNELNTNNQRPKPEGGRAKLKWLNSKVIVAGSSFFYTVWLGIL